jgi:polysaccharide chain length determinant protein (PEP-CTERM system associated)
MDEFLGQITTIVRGMWNYRRLAVAVSWLVGAIGMVVVFTMPDNYQASARVYVDTQSILRPLMVGIAVQPNIEQQVAMLSRTLLSRPTVERLVRTVDLDLNAKTAAAKDAIIDGVTKSISIQSTGRDNLYTLAYKNKNPEVAQRVVQALLTIFVESSLGATRQDSDSARRFLDNQIKNYESKLTEAEARLKEFKLRNIDLQSEAGLDFAGRAAEVNSLLSQAKLELNEAESARTAAKRQLDMLRTQGQAGQGIGIQTPEIDIRITTQQSNLDALLQRFTENHPDVVNTRRLIEELNIKKAQELARIRREASKNPSALFASTSPAIQELSRLYSEAEIKVASLRARVTEYEYRSSQARSQLKVAPKLEAELAQLDRDYDIHKKNYEDLVKRRESALMSGELESTSNVADFRVIDPPRVNPKPVAPNRILLLPLALLIALAAGAGASFVISQIRPVFFDGASLRQATQIPLLGVIELIPTQNLRNLELKSLKRFVIALTGLLCVYAVGMALLSYQSRILG